MKHIVVVKNCNLDGCAYTDDIKPGLVLEVYDTAQEAGWPLSSWHTNEPNKLYHKYIENEEQNLWIMKSHITMPKHIIGGNIL